MQAVLRIIGKVGDVQQWVRSAAHFANIPCLLDQGETQPFPVGAIELPILGPNRLFSLPVISRKARSVFTISPRRPPGYANMELAEGTNSWHNNSQLKS
jgi:hypothetical protein